MHVTQSNRLSQHRSCFHDKLGYTRPYPQRATLLSLPVALRAGIIEASFPADVVDEYYQHICSSRHLCPILKTLLHPFLRLGLVSREWQRLITDSYARLTTALWKTQYGGPKYPYAKTVNNWLGGMNHGLIGGRFRVIVDVAIEEHDNPLAVTRAKDVQGTYGCREPQQTIVKIFKLNSTGSSARYDREWIFWSKLDLSKPSPVGFPRLIHHGTKRYKTKNELYWYRYLAMERVGSSLVWLQDLCPGRKLPLKWVLAVAMQMLDRYKYLYTQKIVHNGCKPSNICLPPREVQSLKSSAPARGQLYLIDFDMATRPVITKRPWPSNPVFASRFFYMQGYSPASASYNTDLESLAYTLVALLRGRLPWWDNPEDSGVTPISELCKGIHPVFAAFARWARGLVPDEDPEHDYHRSLFEKVWVAEKFGTPVGFVDWTAEEEELQRQAYPDFEVASRCSSDDSGACSDAEYFSFALN